MYVTVLSACMDVQHVYLLPKEVRRSQVRPPRTGIKDGYKPQCGCWELNHISPALTPLISNNSTLRTEGGNGS